MENRKIWLNGEIVPVKEAKINVLSPTAQFGANVFEGIRCYWNEEKKQLFAFRLNDHFKRLNKSVQLLQIQCTYSREELEQAFKDIIIANNYYEDIAVRQTIFVDGFGSWFSKEPVGMFVAPIPKRRKEIPLKEAENACFSSWSRIDDNCLSPRAKVGANYMNSRLAKIEAECNGYDVALFLNNHGYIAESTGACFFMISNNKLITPMLTDSVLESITRDTVIQIAKNDLNMTVEERHIDRTEAYLCDEAFICGSAAEITPVGSIDRHLIGGGEPGSITRRIHQVYLEYATGLKKSENNWVTPIYE